MRLPAALLAVLLLPALARAAGAHVYLGKDTNGDGDCEDAGEARLSVGENAPAGAHGCCDTRGPLTIPCLPGGPGGLGDKGFP